MCSRPKGNSAQGICDLLGNVDEWVSDCFMPGYEGAPTDGSPRTDCTGGKKTDYIKGWYGVTRIMTSTGRQGLAPVARMDAVGFRCLRPK